MFKLLLGFKIILYGLVFVRVFERTPVSLPLVLLAVALAVSGFWRNLDEYRRPRVNTFTMHLDLILALLFSLLSDRGSFDKFFIVYLVEGIMVLPKPYFAFYAMLTLVVSGISTSLYELRVEGGLLPPEFAQLLLYGFIIVLVLSERRQREQRVAYEKLAEELKYVNLQLKESMAWSETLASEAERRRIAGEIHDSLGHDLTGLILTLEAGKKLTDRDAEAGREYWDKALQISRTAIDSVRELVSTAREPAPEFELVARIREMAGGVQELTGLRIELDVSLGEVGLSEKEQFNIYRVLQEAVTNTLRHAGADRAHISVSGDREMLCFSYRDNGCGTEHINEGNGLKGMIERVSSIGGTMSFQSKPGGGFRIEGRIDRRGRGSEKDKNYDCRRPADCL